jgi:hypothetical protein
MMRSSYPPQIANNQWGHGSLWKGVRLGRSEMGERHLSSASSTSFIVPVTISKGRPNEISNKERTAERVYR